jgi:hypothetical protein
MTDLDRPQAMAGNSKPKPGKQSKPVRRGTGTIELIIILSLTAVALSYGWLQRDEGDLTAETGVGYYLGITGSLMMLVLLLYPLRKRIAALRILGNVRGWFRIHMIFGIVGPTLIILHSNFEFGSLNSTIAFLSMLIVAGSGLIGRFFYTRIHRGLYGRRASVREYLSDAESFKSELSPDQSIVAGIMQDLRSYEERRLAPSTTFWNSFCRALTSPFARFRLRRRVMHQIRQHQSGTASQSFDRKLKRYLFAVARAEAFALYERLFALWHVLHLPLFIILVFAALAHVVAVHLY